MASMTALEVGTADGFTIHAREWRPAGPVGDVVVIAGAMGVKQDFYEPFAKWLAEQGMAAVTFDYRGMGESRPASLRGFSATIVDWAEKDCSALVDEIDRRHPNARIHWVGHSVGAQLFGLVPNRDRIHAVLSIAAGSGYWRYNARPLRYYVLSLWLLVMPLAIRLTGYFPGKKLNMVGDLPKGVAEQWRAWCLSSDYLGSDEEARERVASAKTPIVALSMQDDEMMTLRGTRQLFGLYKSAPVEIRRVRPKELGVERIGHFGFFRPKMKDALWTIVPAWIFGNWPDATTEASTA